MKQEEIKEAELAFKKVIEETKDLTGFASEELKKDAAKKILLKIFDILHKEIDGNKNENDLYENITKIIKEI